MSDRAKYSRVYWRVLDDDEFDGIRSNESRFGAWTLMLLAADMSWPTPAYIPPVVTRKSVEALAEAGLVELLSGGRFKLRGIDKERGMRSDTGRNASAVRWHSDPPREPDANGMPRQDEQRREETSRDEGARADLDAFLLVKRRAPTPRQRQLLDGILERHDLTGPAWAADIMLRHPDDPIGAVLQADREWREERIKEAQAAEKPKPQPRRRPDQPEHVKELLAHWAATRNPEDDAA